ncbi:unnamed protein product [Larinioides sclopetarius]|uniref:G-protein coupled receptors family 1 profile domain-containing protein n=1 Tax=Larinioides sclopetarius TaxID=280406 RepID=A0AAV1ZZ87_9ARAC
MMMTNFTDCDQTAQRLLLAKMISNMSYEYDTSYFKKLEDGDYVKFFAYIIIIIGGLIGNISVILTVALNRSMRTTINFYVANLAVADALICIFCMGTHSFGTLTRSFALGSFMCKFNTFMQMVCLLSSVLTLSAISCDRFIAIMFPLHVRITKQRTSIVMQIIWVISILVSLPFLFFKKLILFEWRDFVEPVCAEEWPKISYYDEEESECRQIEQYRVTYYVTCSIVLYFIPVIVMMTAYSLILWKLWISEVPGERHAANINVQYRARKKVIKMVLVVLIAFIICWTPMQIQIYISALQSEAQSDKWIEEYQWVSNYLAFANSFINPIIYGGFNKTFREGFCIMLRCGYRRDRFARNPRSRLTFTTGVTSSPSRFTSKTINGTNKNSSQKSNNMEMVPVYHPSGDGDTSPNMKDTCVSIADGKQL